MEANLVHGEGDLFGQPFRATDDQRQFLDRLLRYDPATGRLRTRIAVLGRAKGWGKALALDTPIPTPMGWTTMGELRVGDVLFDERGQRCTVTAATPTMLERECYRVRFSDGSSIVADGDHRWYTEELRHRYRGSVKTTRDIAGSVTLRSDGARNHHVPLAGQLDCPAYDLPVDPYVLGAWLGDGSSHTNTFTCADGELIDHLRSAGVQIRRRRCDADDPAAWAAIGLVPDLRATLGHVAGKLIKRVPAAYLRAAPAQRLALLQGLLDTDGFCDADSGRVEFCSTSEGLASDVVELARSLSFKPVMRCGDATINGKRCGTKFRVQFTAHADTPVFRLSRKADRQRPHRPGRRSMSRSRAIVAVEPVPSVPVRCITVDSPSRLYLAGEAMVPTHNTEFIAAVVLFMLCGPIAPQAPNIPIAAASFEQADLLFGTAKVMATEGPLKPFVEAFDTEILLRDGPGRAFRIAAAAGTNDGGRPTLFAADELHEWTGGRARVFLVVTNSIAKRRDGMTLVISTAGSPESELLRSLYDQGQRVVSGEVVDDGFVFDWREADDELDPHAGPEVRAEMARQANPHIDAFGTLPFVERRWHEIPEHEWRRYFANQWWHAPLDSWLPEGALEACRRDGACVDREAPFVAGVDMALRHDTAAVVVAQDGPDGVVCEAKVWVPHDGEALDIAAIEQHLRQLHRTGNLRACAYDPAWFERSAQALADDGIAMLEVPQSAARMVPAAGHAYETIVAGRLVHDFDPVVTGQVLAAVPKASGEGWRLSKGRAKHKIDAAIALVIAVDEATRHRAETVEESVYDTRGLITL